MGIYGLKQNFLIRPSPFKGNEKGLDNKKSYKILLQEDFRPHADSYRPNGQKV